LTALAAFELPAGNPFVTENIVLNVAIYQSQRLGASKFW
jgi:hypothetical protein